KDIETDFVNIIYKTNPDGKIPYDMQIADLVDGKLNWKELRIYSPDTGLRYKTTFWEGVHYTTKNIKFDKAGTYHIKSELPFGAYQYGFSETGAYGFSANANIYS